MGLNSVNSVTIAYDSCFFQHSRSHAVLRVHGRGRFDDFSFQQDGAVPYFHHDVREYVNTAMLQRWIGRAEKNCRMQ